jgi:hypothetical protein
MRRQFLALAVLVFASLSPLHGADAEEISSNSRVKFDLGIGTWISFGNTTWSHNASSVPPLGNPTSKLTYEDHSANVVELTGKVFVGSRFFGRLNVGFAGIGGGRLTDDDYLTPDDGNPSLRTHSDVDNGGLWYVNADAGTRIVNFPNGRGVLDGFVGFQYWREERKAYGVRQVICTTAGSTVDLGGGQRLCNPADPPISSSTLVITNTTTWYSIRAGLQTEYRVARWLSVQGSAVLKPLSIFENEDTHHLRQSDLQDPSFTMFGIGIGADADVGARVYFSRGLSLNVGYRLFWNRMIDGTWKNHPTTGGSDSFPLREFQSIRHGVTAGLNVTF